MSEASDGSVMVYVTSDNTLIIAGQDGVIAGSYIRFNNFSQVTSLDLSNLDTSKVITMFYMFKDCSSLTSLDLSNFDTSKVTDMGGMFYNCNSLTSLNLSNFDTSKVLNMGDMFKNCSKIKMINVSNKWVVNSRCATTDMFYSCGVSSVTYV